MAPSGYVRRAARVYAVCAMLVGLGTLGAVAFLIAVFGFHPADWELLVLGAGPGFALIVLALFIWRQRAWAMMAALAFAVAMRFMFGTETLLLNIVLTGLALVSAILTGLHLWLRPEPG